MKIEQRKISSLKPAPYNPRQATKQQEENLQKSLTKFGVVEPVIVNDQTGNIVGGHFRVRELKKLGMKEVDCVIVDLSLEDEKELNIRLNANTGGWDFDLLANNFEIEDLTDWGLDVPGFDIAPEATEDDYQIPDEIQTDIVIGDLFEIGEHRLLCGDSTDSDSVAKLMNGEKADMVTDPPYGIDANNQTLGSGKKQFERGNDWDKSTPDFFYLIPMFENIIIWGGNYFTDKLPITNDWLCWDKKNPNLSFSEFELAWTNTGKNCRIFSHHWSGETKLHPTMKPVSVMAWCLEYATNENIFDPFLGSGSTMVAAHQLNRKCYGMELSEKYCQVIIDRMRKLDPTLIIKKNGITTE